MVVTDRAMHVFRDPKGPRLSRLVRTVGPRDASLELRKRMLKVWQGDTTDQVITVAAVDVRRARVGPATGGLWWRLTLTCADGTVVLRGRGDGLEEEAEMRSGSATASSGPGWTPPRRCGTSGTPSGWPG